MDMDLKMAEEAKKPRKNSRKSFKDKLKVVANVSSRRETVNSQDQSNLLARNDVQPPNSNRYNKRPVVNPMNAAHYGQTDPK